ncbi:hypothetical protein WMF30_01550 [Sorangium sp. So ce134]
MRDFYGALRAAGLGFQCVLAWGCPGDLTLDDITAWNQTKLDAGFTLGFDEHVSNDYRQILLGGSPFSECRVILLNRAESYSFHIIVPEEEVTDSRWIWLRSVAEHVWRSLPVAAIQTYGELGAGASLRALDAGAAPASMAFAFYDRADETADG